MLYEPGLYRFDGGLDRIDGEISTVGKSRILISLKSLVNGLNEFENDGTQPTSCIEIIEKYIIGNTKVISSGKK